MRRAIVGGLLIGAVLLVLSGCQALFTTSLFSFAQRDVDNLPLEQQVTYAEQALAGGDAGAMADAFAALADEAVTGDDPEITYLTAQLAMELSGAPDLAFQVMDGTIDFTGSPNAALEELMGSVDGDYVSAAADLFWLMGDNGDLGLLTATDLLLGTGCLLFQAVDANGGDVDTLDSTMVQDSLDFATAGLFVLAAQGGGPGDADYDMLQELADYLGTI